jgi:type II secretory pathway pseudopilin PulG
VTRFTRLATLVATTCMAVASPALAQSAQDSARFRAAQDRLSNELSIFQQEFDRYQASMRGGPRGGYGQQGYAPQGYAPPRGYEDDRVETGYDPARYYRDGPNYQERVLSADDRVYRGQDGRYYCKRNDGTTGLVIGAAAGGIFGNVIAGGHSRTVGTLLGAALGGLAGKSIDQNNADVKCR